MALAATLIFGVIRLLRRQSLRQVLAGLAGTLISVFWAWRSGQVENFFAFGFWINGVYSVVLLITILARRPAIGWLVAGAIGNQTVGAARMPTNFLNFLGSAPGYG